MSETLKLFCPSCSKDAFELRALSDEGVACARCVGCTRDFLVLDSEDHWFDVIHAAYPRLRRCSCKATVFRLSCNYVYRDDGDVKAVTLLSDCLSCGRTKRQMSIDIDYGDTDDLLKRPLRFCKNPNLRYDLKDISLYLTQFDMASIVGHLFAAHQCSFVSWLSEDGYWRKRDLAVDEVQQAILSDRYLRIYASVLPLEFREVEVASSKNEDSFWKREEVIRISSPTRVNSGREQALLYYIQYSNEYVESEAVVQKAKAFRATTTALLQWLGANFVSWRGRLCFDNPTENLRLFGDRFAKKRASDRRLQGAERGDA